MGGTFSIPVNFRGYNEELWKKLGKIVGSFGPEDVVFAVETSCNLWKTIVGYLSKKGYTVLLVSPLVTYQSRPMMNNDYSKTDPKDALLIADNAHKGHYSHYRVYSPEINELHSLCIAYDKLTKDRSRNTARLRALLEEIFPEYPECLNVGIDTSLYLLERYFLPEHFQALNIKEEAANIYRISRGNHGLETLQKLKEHAQRSIGVGKAGEEAGVRLVLDAWIAEIRQLGKSIDAISGRMIELAQRSEYFEILTSLMGISDISAARFIGECRDLSLFNHYKQIEKMAGLNLRLCDSGKYAGTRRINKLGNKRLSKLVFQMTTQTARFVPEVRIKFIKRQMKKQCYRKNIIAASPVLLKILMALIKGKRKYEYRQDKVMELARLELRYNPQKKNKKTGRKDKKGAGEKALCCITTDQRAARRYPLMRDTQVLA
ncbi:MAG TPA: transposase, partial [Thermodesulfovibrionales bacterium]|nr:transposase [Thermodesulfovibrionales bacterium]